MSKFGDWLFGVEQRSTDVPPATNSGDNHIARTAPTRDAVDIVNPTVALGLSAVYRAVSLIGTGAVQLSIDVFRNDQSVNVPAYIRQPNVNQTQRDFVKSTVVSLALNGNAYWLIDRSSAGQVLNLSILDPAKVQINWDPMTGVINAYNYGDKSYTPDQIRHMKLTTIPGQVKGLGPIQAARQDLLQAHDTRNFGAEWFQSGGVPSRGYLKSDQNLNAEQSQTVRDAWTDANKKPDGIPVLGNGFDYKGVVLSPSDAQWLESQRFNVVTIARMFGIPAGMLLAEVEGTSETYANINQEWTAFARWTLMDYLTVVEDAFSTLIPGNAVAKFNLEALLRADTTTRYTSYTAALGWMTPNEIRAIEGLPPIAGGDKLKSASAPAPSPAPEAGGRNGDE